MKLYINILLYIYGWKICEFSFSPSAQFWENKRVPLAELLSITNQWADESQGILRQHDKQFTITLK